MLLIWSKERDGWEGNIDELRKIKNIYCGC